MKLILEITSHSGDGTILHRTVEEFPATLGRGYHNDIILSDPHVSAHHLRIDYDGQNWWAKDLGSENGIFINSKLYKNAVARLASGDVLRAGRTELRVFSPDHPVPTAVLMQKANPLFLFLTRPLTVWLSFAAALGVMVGWSYLEIWSEQPGMTLSVAAGAVFCAVMIWAALWSVAGRLIKHKPHFQSHVALISLYIIGSALCWYVQSYIDFLTSENIIAILSNYAFNLFLFALLLYGALALATDMPKKKRLTTAVYFSIGVAASTFLIGHAGAMEFSPDPLYPYTMEPYLSELAPAKPIDAFMQENASLFESDLFNAKPAEEHRE